MVNTVVFGTKKAIEECSVLVDSQWFLYKGMILNADKSDIIVLWTAQQELLEGPVLNVAGFDIKPSNSIRSLGVVIDDRLTLLL